MKIRSTIWKISCLLLLLTQAKLQVHAQHHSNAWCRTTLRFDVTHKFLADAEFQHRRQNGFENHNMFDKSLMYTFRTWVHYKHNEDVKFSLSPFAIFLHNTIVQTADDESIKARKEIRFTAAAELQHELLESFFIIDRNAVEYRMFENNQPDIVRLRNRLGLRYDFSKKIRLSIFDELLLNLHGASAHHFFDHDRLGATLDYKLNSKLNVDFGYIHIKRLPQSEIEKLTENNFFLNLTIHLS